MTETQRVTDDQQDHRTTDDFERSARLRRASDTYMQRLDRLFELESRKRELMPDRPEFVRLAREVEDMTRALLGTSTEQVELAEAVHADAKAGDVDTEMPIRETPPRREAVAILAEWRAAERRLAAAELGSPEEADARGVVERLRVEYRRATVRPPEDDRL